MPPTTETKTTKKAPAVMDRAMALKRAETVEQRIVKLEGKLAKDRELYKKYTDIVTKADAETVVVDSALV